MKKFVSTFPLAAILFFSVACAKIADPSSVAQKTPNIAAESASGRPENSSNAEKTPPIAPPIDEPDSFRKDEPRTVREFFNLLPQEYFTLEGCEPQKDKNCEKARREYVKTFLEIEDAKNDYWKSGCDGGQSCLSMSLFKRPDDSYIVHVLTEFEGGEDAHFLEYKNGKWTDIGANIIPEYADKNTYVPPRYGTTVEVYKKNFPEPTYSERGAKIYDLTWKDGKFSKAK